jgi:hypothetical protein
MEIRHTTGLLNALLLQENQNRGDGQPVPAVPKNPPRKTGIEADIVSVRKSPADAGNNNSQQGFQQNLTRLVDEEIRTTENGFRKTQEFQTKEGRSFTRIEDITSTSNRTRRVVIQQHSSGSTTALEDVFDRQEDGTFRLTRRFTDETGKTTTNIELNVTPPNKDIVLGRIPDPGQNNNDPYEVFRGTQFDVSA